jgi:hypothetical protein
MGRRLVREEGIFILISTYGCGGLCSFGDRQAASTLRAVNRDAVIECRGIVSEYGEG